MIRAAWRGAWQLACALLVLAAGVHAAEREPARVVTSIRPLALIVRAVGGAAVQVQVLPGVEASPHDFVLRPAALERLTTAQLFVWMGPSLERPLERLLGRLDTTPGLALLARLDAAGGDPHLWLDPRQARAMARVIAQELAARGLVEQSLAEANLASFDTAMQASEQAIASEFAGMERVPFITLHDGLGPLVRRFGLNQVGALPATHEVQPGARSVAALRKVARQSGAACLFREPGDRVELAATIAEGQSMRIVEIDPLARTVPDDMHGFEQFLTSLAREMNKCLRTAVPAKGESSA